MYGRARCRKGETDLAGPTWRRGGRAQRGSPSMTQLESSIVSATLELNHIGVLPSNCGHRRIGFERRNARKTLTTYGTYSRYAQKLLLGP